jgi:hypothetical protein
MKRSDYISGAPSKPMPPRPLEIWKSKNGFVVVVRNTERGVKVRFIEWDKEKKRYVYPFLPTIDGRHPDINRYIHLDKFGGYQYVESVKMLASLERKLPPEPVFSFGYGYEQG